MLLSVKMKDLFLELNEQKNNKTKYYPDEIMGLLRNYIPKVEKLENDKKELIEALKRNIKIYCNNCPDDCSPNTKECNNCFVINDYKLLEKVEKEI